MPTVKLVVPATAEQARTARLVVGAAARRAGVDPDALDDVRLAVAEAVALAVHRCADADAPAAVELRMIDEGDRFTVEVADAATEPPADLDDVLLLSLPLIRSLAADSQIGPNEQGGQTVSLTWPHAESAE